MRTIVIGDIHGCLEEFDELLRKVAYERGKDRLVLLGDLMDKGPDPVGVVRRAREVGAEMVLGNHDEKHLRWRAHEDKRAANPSYKNPMRPMKEPARSQNAALSEDDFAWLLTRPIIMRLDFLGPRGQLMPVIAVHGGFEPGLPLDQQRENKLLRARYVDAAGKMVPITSDTDQPAGTVRWATAWREPMHAIYGHHCMQLGEVTVDIHDGEDGTEWYRFAMDTGCVYGGRLSALLVDGAGPRPFDVVQVDARATYAELWTGDE